MAADVKLVRLRSPGGAVVETSEENAARLLGFEPIDGEKPAAKKTAAKRSTSKSS